MDKFIEDDAEKMIRIIEKEFTELSKDYLLNKEEVEKIANNLKNTLTESTLKDMYADSNKHKYANNLIKPYVEYVVKEREKIELPTEEEMCQELKIILEEMADNENN